MSKLFLALFFLVACTAEEPLGAAPAAATADDLRVLLTARHPQDLPGKEALARHPGAAQTLRDLAWNDDKLIIRRRAADTLGILAVDDPVAEGYLVELLEAPEPGTRAGALHGLGRLDLTKRPALRTRIEALTASPDLLVARAAVAALGDPARLREFNVRRFGQPTAVAVPR